MPRRRSGLLAGLFKLVLYGVISVVALSVVYPALLEDPSRLTDDIQRAEQAAETGTTVDTDRVDVRALERRIHREVNRRRASHDLQQLSFDTALAAIARQYSEDMARRNFFSHYSPEGNDFSDRYERAGYECRIRSGDRIYGGGENLARNYMGRPVSTADGRETYTTINELAQAVVTGWMHSPEHRDNLLNPVWGREGIGAYLQDDGEVYVTQNFC